MYYFHGETEGLGCLEHPFSLDAYGISGICFGVTLSLLVLPVMDCKWPLSYPSIMTYIYVLGEF